MATPDDHARAMCLLVYRWLCHAEGKLEQFGSQEVEGSHWRRWQDCLIELVQVLEEYRRA